MSDLLAAAGPQPTGGRRVRQPDGHGGTIDVRALGANEGGTA